MLMAVVKTTLNLPDEIKARVAATGRARHISEAEVIRDTLARGLAAAEPPRIIGMVDAGGSVRAEDIDAEPAAGFGANEIAS
jgi:hypothetical protein